MSHLRNLALTVDEGEPGEFTWIIMESDGDAVVYDETRSHSQGHYPSYEKALDEGVKAWKAMCAGQLQHGPRAIGEDEGGNPVGKQDIPEEIGIPSPS
jgi:hypothetical protein